MIFTIVSTVLKCTSGVDNVGEMCFNCSKSGFRRSILVMEIALTSLSRFHDQHCNWIIPANLTPWFLQLVDSSDIKTENSVSWKIIRLQLADTTRKVWALLVCDSSVACPFHFQPLVWTWVVCPFHFRPSGVIEWILIALGCVPIAECVLVLPGNPTILTVLGGPRFQVMRQAYASTKQFSLFGKDHRVESKNRHWAKGQSHSFIHYSISIYSALIKYPLRASCLLAPGDNGHCLVGLKKDHYESIQ